MAGCQDRKRFLLSDNGDTGIIVYATDQVLKQMSELHIWFMNDNSDMSTQYCAKLGEITVSAVYAILQRKIRDIYEELFHTL